MVVLLYLDRILVPMSIIISIGYHVYLAYCFKNKPLVTTLGVNTIRRRKWAQTIIEDPNEKTGTLVIQSLRNSQMGSILGASVTILIISSLAAITNNAYNASDLLNNSYFGSQSIKTILLKYCFEYSFLVFSFFCSSMAVVCFVQLNFLLHVAEFSPGYVQDMFERGCWFAFLGNRAFYVTVPLLLWIFGPVPMMLSTMALVWVLYQLDFCMISCPTD
ncbi:hypothetical protein MKW94_023617 [Papaver nudicaule]|uniref:DUF599 domain-containing protein n=1 Tax=Papaver nudicaule TaxID=74823 RepID=A0AA41V9F4_PAPNU|nr:hypothetical protein [Papaver nudicaule]